MRAMTGMYRAFIAARRQYQAPSDIGRMALAA
jgi:hypothetical protein